MAVTESIASSGFPLGFKFRQGSSRPAVITGAGRGCFVAEARHFSAHHQKEAIVTEGEHGSSWRMTSDEGLHIKGDNLVKIVHQIYRVIPGVLLEQGKTNNPWPNVDAHSGVLLNHYGITEMNYYTVLFGVSRALGVLASLTWDRIFGLPLERPKSETTASLKALLTKAQ